MRAPSSCPSSRPVMRFLNSEVEPHPAPGIALRVHEPAALLPLDREQVAPVGAGRIAKALALFCHEPVAVGAEPVPLALVLCAEPLAFPDASVAAAARALHPPALEFSRLLAAHVLHEFAVAAALIVLHALLAPDLPLPALERFRPRGEFR